MRIGTTTIEGNSGGPVLDSQGHLIGIHSRSDRHMISVEIPAIRVVDLVSDLKEANVYSIENRTAHGLHFYSWMNPGEEPESFHVGPNEHRTMWNYFQLSPEIAFDYDMTEETQWNRCRPRILTDGRLFRTMQAIDLLAGLMPESIILSISPRNTRLRFVIQNMRIPHALRPVLRAYSDVRFSGSIAGHEMFLGKVPRFESVRAGQ